VNTIIDLGSVAAIEPIEDISVSDSYTGNSVRVLARGEKYAVTHWVADKLLRVTGDTGLPFEATVDYLRTNFRLHYFSKK
jgi:hypothetical protein